MPVEILGGSDIDPADAARLRAFAEETLDALGAADLEVPVHVAERGPDDPRAGWANRWGVNIAADQLDEDDDELRHVVCEEVAHFWFILEHGDDGGDYTHELWACWAVSRLCDADWQPPDELDQSDSYQLGRLVGGVLAGSPDAREAFNRLEPRLRGIIGDLVDHLDGCDDPREFAGALARYKPPRSSDETAVDALLEAFREMNAQGL